MFLLRKQEDMNWKHYARQFEIPTSAMSNLPVLDRIAKLSEHWLQREVFPMWWKLRKILFNCCAEYIAEIRRVMHDIQQQVVTGKNYCSMQQYFIILMCIFIHVNVIAVSAPIIVHQPYAKYSQNSLTIANAKQDTYTVKIYPELMNIVFYADNAKTSQRYIKADSVYEIF